MEEPLRWMKRNYRIILPFYLFAAVLFVLFLAISSDSRNETFDFVAGWSGVIWWIGVMGIGILVPWILVLKRDKKTVRFPWFLSGCLIAGDFLLRLVLIFAGQGIL
jgi:formate-dependent nitrite reductase membrane component NrfD